MDIPIINGKYTWNNKRGGSRHIASGLDRFLVTKNFISEGVYYEATILPCLGLDHWPIKLQVEMKQGNRNRKFRFEAFWLREPALVEKWSGGMGVRKKGEI